MTARQRKMEALRRLADNPGYPAEGEAARRMLEKLEAMGPEPAANGPALDQRDWDAIFASAPASQMQSAINMLVDELLQDIRSEMAFGFSLPKGGATRGKR